MTKDLNLSCPVPHAPDTTVTLAHGSGGRLMHQLIGKIFLSAFTDPALHEAHDGARLEPCPDKLAFTTDSFVVRPMFFPGGDIGSLAVHGTCNDLAMCGAQPMYLSCGFMGHGFMMAPIVGKLYAEWLSGGQKHEIFERCTLSRFTAGGIQKEDFIIG